MNFFDGCNKNYLLYTIIKTYQADEPQDQLTNDIVLIIIIIKC